MFGYQGGESPETVARKKGYGRDAQKKWKFLTNFDLSTIKNRQQLQAMIHVRSGISDQQAERDVEAWMEGRNFGYLSGTDQINSIKEQ